MRIDAQATDYLEGRRLSNGHRFEVPHSPMKPRDQLLVELSAGKRVLHVGCADHVGLIAKKRANGSYLHDQLTSAAQGVVGVDTNAEALDEMRGLGIENLYLPEELPAGLEFDLILAPDVIEHVGNVDGFLTYLRQFGAPVAITTPNAFRLENRFRWGHEFVNTDHRYWFSPYTLSKSLVSAGFCIQTMYYTDSPSKKRPHRWFLAKTFPACRDGLAIVAMPATGP